MQLIIFSALIQLAFGSPIRADGVSQSPGFASGNVIQAPANIPLNVCGITVSVIGALNPTFGNSCINNSHNLNSDGSNEITIDAPISADVAPTEDAETPAVDTPAAETPAADAPNTI